MLSNRYLKQEQQNVQTLHDILEVNKKVSNFDFTDKILRAIYRIDQRNEPLIKQIIENFNEGSKNTVTLIP
jgi:tRNA A37 N6-isopentenylltransferase MiaA